MILRSPKNENEHSRKTFEQKITANNIFLNVLNDAHKIY